MAGCLGRQVSLSCPTGGGGEDAQALKGSERAGWDKNKNLQVPLLPSRLDHPRLLAPCLRVPHIFGLKQVRDVADMKFFCTVSVVLVLLKVI